MLETKWKSIVIQGGEYSWANRKKLEKANGEYNEEVDWWAGELFSVSWE